MSDSRNTHALSLLQDQFYSSEKANPSFISIRRVPDGNVLVSGNEAGLLRLALIICELATQNVGNHVHIDSASEADEADLGLIVSVVDAPWNNGVGDN